MKLSITAMSALLLTICVLPATQANADAKQDAKFCPPFVERYQGGSVPEATRANFNGKLQGGRCNYTKIGESACEAQKPKCRWIATEEKCNCEKAPAASGRDLEVQTQ